MKLDYTKIIGKSSTGQSSLSSAGNALSSQSSAVDQLSSQIAQRLSTLEQADLKQKTAGAIISAAQKLNDELNNMVSSLCKPIFDAVQEFKTVPPKIRSIVDIDGAANGMYDRLGKLQASVQSLSNLIVSAEVPITLDDYNASPYQYQSLLAIQYQKNEVTEEDCLSSGYTKVVQTVDPVWMKKLIDQFPAPEDRDVVGIAMEKLIGQTIKTAWSTVAPPIQTVASIAPIGPVSDMVKAVIDATDNIVKIASVTVPEETLNKMVAEKQAATEKAAAEAAKATLTPNPAGMSEKDRAEQAQKQAESAVSQVAAGVTDGLVGAFQNMQAPEFPDDIKHTLEDFKDSLIMVKDNISNIYIVVILKMIGAIFDCFNQIVGVIGVPSIPDPLGKIPQLISDVNSVMTFVMGLPMSMVKCVEAIVKRKMKMIQVCMTPVPPKPLPTLVPVPPTSKDVVKPDIDWENVKKKLVDKYIFSDSVAKKIVENIQLFYDGSNDAGMSTGVIDGADEKQNQYGTFDWLPTYKYIRRYKMQAIDAFEKFIPSSVTEYHSGFDTQYMIDIPKKGGPERLYYKLDRDNFKEYIDCSDVFIIEHFFSNRKETA